MAEVFKLLFKEKRIIAFFLFVHYNERGGMTMYYSYFESLVGPMTLIATAQAIVGVHFGKKKVKGAEKKTPLLKTLEQELKEYFAGERKEFDLPLEVQGTVFQQNVWKELEKIPYGETRSYQEVAEGIGNAKAVRAVGMANHRNPIAILIPCHRVIGKNQTLVGYAGGLSIKQRLLELEGNDVL